MIKVLTIFGTRPEAIKVAPVIIELLKHPNNIKVITCSTGQHRELLEGIFNLFKIRLDYDLKLMMDNQSLFQITNKLFKGLTSVIEKEKPDWILAQGDTTSVMVASILSYYGKIKFGHIEAGLRTNNLYSPFPEEGNRIIADNIAHRLWAPTTISAENLIKGGINKSKIIITGNTVIDSLRIASEMPDNFDNSISKKYLGKKLVLITVHRRESFGTGLINIFEAIRSLAKTYSGLTFVYPVHFNPNVRKFANELLKNIQNLDLIEPIPYIYFIHLMKQSHLILTDSGGLQEEAPFFNVPVLVMRDTTERPEGIHAGVAALIGTKKDKIIEEVKKVLDNKTIYKNMTTAVNPYGDGFAAKRIVKSIIESHDD
jgi:UDP-N-acetylglucosamine 2-epimerase (non-hydrolysing)